MYKKYDIRGRRKLSLNKHSERETATSGNGRFSTGDSKPRKHLFKVRISEPRTRIYRRLPLPFLREVQGYRVGGLLNEIKYPDDKHSLARFTFYTFLSGRLTTNIPYSDLALNGP